MFEKKSQSIGTCFKTTKGTLVLYRSFGCAAVDESLPPMKRYIVEQLAEYYPDVKLNQIRATLNANGTYTFTVQTREG